MILGERWLFLHIPRTGGTTIAHALTEATTTLGLNRPSARFHKHLKLAEVVRVLPLRLEAVTVFAFVRNPWDHVVSIYEWWRQKGPRFAHTAASAKQVEAMGFSGFVASPFLRHVNEWPGTPLDWLTLDGRVAVDLVGRFERLQADWDRVCDRIGLPRHALPRLNETARRDYRSYYDARTRRAVAERFAREIALFGYRFDEPAPADAAPDPGPAGMGPGGGGSSPT